LLTFFIGERTKECRDAYSEIVDSKNPDELAEWKLSVFETLAEQTKDQPKKSVGARMDAAEKALYLAVSILFSLFSC
jgi:F0F1-type ATP synthase beta subunit